MENVCLLILTPIPWAQSEQTQPFPLEIPKGQVQSGKHHSVLAPCRTGSSLPLQRRAATNLREGGWSAPLHLPGDLSSCQLQRASGGGGAQFPPPEWAEWTGHLFHPSPPSGDAEPPRETQKRTITSFLDKYCNSPHNCCFPPGKILTWSLWFCPVFSVNCLCSFSFKWFWSHVHG